MRKIIAIVALKNQSNETVEIEIAPEGSSSLYFEEKVFAAVVEKIKKKPVKIFIGQDNYLYRMKITQFMLTITYRPESGILWKHESYFAAPSFALPKLEGYSVAMWQDDGKTFGVHRI